jgi:hypothetical protein
VRQMESGAGAGEREAKRSTEYEVQTAKSHACKVLLRIIGCRRGNVGPEWVKSSAVEQICL